jgi:hypothetical protein
MQKRAFTTDQRKRYAKEGIALPDGSYPIVNADDLRNAIHAYGRAKPSKRAKVRAHIIRRARALGLSDMVPAKWKDSRTTKVVNTIFTKSYVDVDVDSDTINFTFPFMKVDVDNRIVEGFSTLDNVDKAREIVDFEASRQAFAKWPGNIREMHQPIAVGRAIDVMEKNYVDEDGTTYRGFWVKARISEGAEDTWKKVLDGTLNGFSLGGVIHEKQSEIRKNGDHEELVWRITKYDLTEISLVDNPCNGLAKITLAKCDEGGSWQYADVVSFDWPACCYHEELMAVVDALDALRDKAIEYGDDHVVEKMAEVVGPFREWMQHEMEMHDQVAEYDTMSEDENVNTNEVNKLHKNVKYASNDDMNNLSEEESNLLLKFAAKVLSVFGGDKVETTNEEGEKMEKNDVTTEDVEKLEKSDETTVETPSEEEGVETLAKLFDEKIAGVVDVLAKVEAALERFASAEAVEALSKSLDEKLDQLVKRIEELENSGATKKSADVVAETLTKSEEGLWNNTIVPPALKARL